MKETARRLGRKKIYQGYSFDVMQDVVRWPNGKVLKRDLIVHPGISVIVPVLDERHLVLVRQYRYGADRSLWEVPAGTMAKGESPLACARREIVEEIGYRAGNWKKIAEVFASPGYITERLHCFVATGLTLDKPAPEEDEVMQIKIFKTCDVRKMVKTRKIVDVKSLIALFYFWEGRL